MSWELGISAEVVAHRLRPECVDLAQLQASCINREEEEGIFKAKTMNEVGSGRDRATTASVIHGGGRIAREHNLLASPTARHTA
jgi:hypothetical protein